LHDKDIEIWEPDAIHHELEQVGVHFIGEDILPGVTEVSVTHEDSELRETKKLVRYFMRSTHISESVLLIKLGARGQSFIDSVLPRLLDAGVFLEIENRGGGDQRRFKLGIPLARMNRAMCIAQGDFSVFLEQFRCQE